MKRKLIFALLFILTFFICTLTANAENSYNITYDYGVAGIRETDIINTNPASVLKNEKITLSVPECDGFEFVGWYLESNYITPADELTVTSDITVFAKWYEMSYSIDYVLTSPDIPVTANEIINSNPHIRFASEEVFLTDAEYVSDRYMFDGWYTDENYTEKIDIIPSDTYTNLTLYAKWVNAEFNIFYELGAVANSTFTTDNPNPATYIYSNAVTIAPAVTNDPAFSFEGWYTDEFFTQKVESISADTIGDITLYANWNKTVYNIEYNLNHNCDIDISTIENPNDSTRTADVDFVLKDPVSADKSFVFAGWYTSPDFSDYSSVSKISKGVTENTLLYAKWEQAVYKISYNYAMIDTYQCHVENTNPVKYYFGDVIDLAPLDVNGFIFNGWCTDADLKNHITEITADMYGDITLYADFTEKTYTITYVLADKEVTANQVGNKNSNIRTTTERFYFNDPETINTNYYFGGWYFDKDFTQKADFIKAYTTSNITVYAKWVQNISYVPEWGDASLSEQLSTGDARLILRYSVALETFNDLQKQISDLNNDSKVTAADARLALRLATGLDTIDELTELYSLPEIRIADGEIVFIQNDKKN